MLGYYQLEDGVTQKFKALIIEVLLLFFVSDARMSEGLRQEMRISKLITDALFERMHFCLRGWRAAWLLLVNSDGSDHIDRPLQVGIVQRRGVSRPRAFSGLRGIDLRIGAT